MPEDKASFLKDRWDVLLVIGAGGALGSLARWGVSHLLPWSGDTFPWATFLENVSGGLALGMLMVLLLDVWPPHRYLRPFLGVGLLGGYTTFSTYMLEARDLLPHAIERRARDAVGAGDEQRQHDQKDDDQQLRRGADHSRLAALAVRAGLPGSRRRVAADQAKIT